MSHSDHVTRHPFGDWHYDSTCPVAFCECPCNDTQAAPEYTPAVQHHEGVTGCWVNREDEATATSGQVPCRTLCLACVGNKHDYSMLDNVI